MTIDARRELSSLDHATYRAVANTPLPMLDEPLRRVSSFANHSKPWLISAAAFALVGGRQGRHAAFRGVVAIGITSFVVNVPMKLAGRRRRPDRDRHQVPVDRHVPMPSSTSFPSGHSASAAAFAAAVGRCSPPLRVPLGIAAAVVGFSRVYTGVHYPGDVLAGAAVGAIVGSLVSK